MFDVPFDLLALAASAGGISALKTILAELPEDFPAAVLIVQHLPSSRQWQSQLKEVLQWRTTLQVKWAQHGERLRPGVAYIAPQDGHMMVDSNGRIVLEAGPTVNFCRPAADRLFKSLSQFGKRVVCVVLTGSNDDGSSGAREIALAGGRVLTQDEESSEAFEMPFATIRKSPVDFVLPLSHIAKALIVLFMVPGGAEWFQVNSSFPSVGDEQMLGLA